MLSLHTCNYTHTRHLVILSVNTGITTHTIYHSLTSHIQYIHTLPPGSLSLTLDPLLDTLFRNNACGMKRGIETYVLDQGGLLGSWLLQDSLDGSLHSIVDQLNGPHLHLRLGVVLV